MRIDVITASLEDPRVCYSLIRIGAPVVAGADGVARAAARRPVNLVLVLDRSSSMRGPRLAQAALAARELVDRLGEGDRLGIVAFDAQARVIVPAGPVDAAARTAISAALAKLETGAGTNLGAALKKGCELAAAGYVREAVSRVILLTDGQASVGTTDPEKLATLAEVEAARGVTITAMGIGEGFDDALLANLARAGKGGFYYLATPAAIPAAFGRELAGVFAIAATGVELKILPEADVTSCEVLHRLPTRGTAEGLIVELGELATGAPRQVLLKLVRAAGSMPAEPGKLLAKVAATWRDPTGQPGAGHLDRIATASLPITADIAEVALERLRLAVATAVDEAWARRASGQRTEAMEALVAVRSAIAGARERALAPTEALNELLLEVASAEAALVGTAGEIERARRSAREKSLVTLLGHSVIRPVQGPGFDGDE